MNILPYIQRGLLAAGLIVTLSPLHAQQVKLGTPDYVKHKMLTTDIRTSPGVVGDDYYVIYTDFGVAFGVKRNLDTYIKDYSIKRGHLTKSIYLNPVISPKDNGVFINHVYLWKDRFLVLFTEKGQSGSQFPVSGQLVDLDGKAVGSPVPLGFYPHASRATGLAARAGTFMNGRFILGPLGALQTAFSSDSATMAILTAPEGAKDQGTLVIIDSGLHVVDKLNCDFPIDANEFQLLQFRQYASGAMYALIREGRTLSRKNATYDLFRLDTRTHRTTRIPLEAHGAIPLDARIGFDDQGNVLVTGTYARDAGHGKLTATEGVFAIRVSGTNGLVTGTDVQPFPAELVRNLNSRRAAAKGKGLDQLIEMRKLVPLAGGGLAAMGQIHFHTVIAQGQTGALNQGAEEFGDVIYYQVSPEGKILWSGGVEREERNPEMMTTTGPIYLGNAGGRALVLYDAEKKDNHYRTAVYQELYDEKGTPRGGSAVIPWPRHNKSRILWSTAVPLDEHHVVASYYSLSDKATGLVTITLAE